MGSLAGAPLDGPGTAGGCARCSPSRSWPPFRRTGVAGGWFGERVHPKGGSGVRGLRPGWWPVIVAPVPVTVPRRGVTPGRMVVAQSAPMSHLRITDPDGFRLDVGPRIVGRPADPDRIELLISAPEGDGIAVDFDGEDAGTVGDFLVQWAFERGRRPAPHTSAIRWHLPDSDVLAVLVERAVTGEEPTAENIARFTQAYREALNIALALPEVLGLLEELNPIDGDEHGDPAEVGADVLYRLLHGSRENLCRAQHHVASSANSEALGRAVALIDSVGHLLPNWSRFDRDDLVPAGDDDGTGPFPKVDDLRRVVVLADVVASHRPVGHPDRMAVDTLRRSLDGLPVVAGGDTVPLHIDDLVEDEDGAPLPDSVQTLIASAERVVGHRDYAFSTLAGAIDGLAVSVARVRMESRRGDPVEYVLPLPADVAALIAAAHRVVEQAQEQDWGVTLEAVGGLALALCAVDPETNLTTPDLASTAAIVDRGDLDTALGWFWLQDGTPTPSEAVCAAFRRLRDQAANR